MLLWLCHEVLAKDERSNRCLRRGYDYGAFGPLRIWCTLGGVTVDSLAALLLGLAVKFAPPGLSPHSQVVVSECGNEPGHCAVGRPCDRPILSCRPPRWSPRRRVWLRYEQEDEATSRYRRVTEVIARTAHQYVAGQAKEAVEYRWPGSATELALATLTVALHESGLRRDVQFGDSPLGRGPQGESCLLQLHLEQAPRFASWVPDDEKEALSRSRSRRETFAQSLLGDDRAALVRCFSIGMRMLARSRRACSASGHEWVSGMFSMYGSGTRCRVPALDNRTRTFKALEALAQQAGKRRKGTERSASKVGS